MDINKIFTSQKTPTETFNKKVWAMLNKIKSREHLTKYGQKIKMVLAYDQEEKTNSEFELLEKMEEMGIIKIKKVAGRKDKIALFTIDRTNFDKLYDKYKNSCDWETFLNNEFQQKLLDNIKNGRPEDEGILKFLNVDKNGDQNSKPRKMINKNLIKSKTLGLDIYTGVCRVKSVKNKFFKTKLYMKQGNFKLLKILIEKRNKIIPYEEFATLFDEKFDKLPTLKSKMRMAIYNLKVSLCCGRNKKMFNLDIIESVPDFGYKLND